MLLSVRGLWKTYRRGSLLTGTEAPALRGVELSVGRGARLVIAGVSGSGKSTLARCIAGWEAADRGVISIATSACFQLIPQNPGESLNPRLSAREIVEEPYRIRGRHAPERVSHWIAQTGLTPDFESRLPGQLSGGERARLAIARALAAADGGVPALLIFDESFSSLDLPLQERMFELLARLQPSLDLSYMLVSHDVTLVARFAREVAIMDDGRIVEQGLMQDVLARPRTHAARDLVSIFAGGAACAS